LGSVNCNGRTFFDGIRHWSLSVSTDKVRESTVTTYEIRAITFNNTDKKLIEINNGEKALFIQKTLKDYLHMKDDQQKILVYLVP
jgi:hypothetical protein